MTERREEPQQAPGAASSATPGVPSPTADRERIILLECRLQQLRSQLEDARAEADRARSKLAESSAHHADDVRRYSLLQDELAHARSEIASLHQRLDRSEDLRARVEGHLFDSGSHEDASELVRLRREVVIERQRALANDRTLARLRNRVDELLASRDTLLARVAEWQQLLHDEGPEAADLSQYIAELRREILELEHRSAVGEDREAALRERLTRAELEQAAATDELREPAQPRGLDQPDPLPSEHARTPSDRAQTELEDVDGADGVDAASALGRPGVPSREQPNPTNDPRVAVLKLIPQGSSGPTGNGVRAAAEAGFGHGSYSVEIDAVAEATENEEGAPEAGEGVSVGQPPVSGSAPEQKDAREGDDSEPARGADPPRIVANSGDDADAAEVGTSADVMEESDLAPEPAAETDDQSATADAAVSEAESLAELREAGFTPEPDLELSDETSGTDARLGEADALDVSRDPDPAREPVSESNGETSAAEADLNPAHAVEEPDLLDSASVPVPMSEAVEGTSLAGRDVLGADLPEGSEASEPVPTAVSNANDETSLVEARPAEAGEPEAAEESGPLPANDAETIVASVEQSPEGVGAESPPGELIAERDQANDAASVAAPEALSDRPGADVQVDSSAAASEREDPAQVADGQAPDPAASTPDAGSPDRQPDPLVAALESADAAAVRSELLVRIRGSERTELLELVRPCTESPQASVRAAAYEALSRLLERDPAALEPEIRAGLSDPDARVRRRVVIAAATARGLPLRSLLDGLRQDKDPQVSRVVREVLRNAPPASAAAPLASASGVTA